MDVRHLSVVLLGGLLLGGGCQKYQPEPLHLESHRVLWNERSADAPEVAAFARRLAESGRLTEAFDVSDGIALAEAEVIALVFNSSLRQARATANVAAASARFAGLWEDPVLDVDVLRILESVPNPWIMASAIGFTVPISGRLGAEKSRANAEEFAALARVAQREWEVVNELRAAWCEWSAAELRLELTTDLLERLNGTVAVITRLEEAGELPRLETRLFAIEAATRAGSALGLEARARELELAISQLMGLRPEAPLQMIPQLSATSLPPASDRESALLDANPAIVVARAEYDIAEHTLHREIRKQYPDLVLGPAYEDEQGQSRLGFIGSFPIPLLNRNRQGIAEAMAHRDASRVAAEALFESLVHELARAEHALEQRRRLREHFETSLIPLVDEQVRDVHRLLELGEINTLVQLESVIRETEAKLQLIEARQEEALASVRVGSFFAPMLASAPSESELEP